MCRCVPALKPAVCDLLIAINHAISTVVVGREDVVNLLAVMQYIVAHNLRRTQSDLRQRRREGKTNRSFAPTKSVKDLH